MLGLSSNCVFSTYSILKDGGGETPGIEKLKEASVTPLLFVLNTTTILPLITQMNRSVLHVAVFLSHRKICEELIRNTSIDINTEDKVNVYVSW